MKVKMIYNNRDYLSWMLKLILWNKAGTDEYKTKNL